jgi:hypothetical protein
VPALQPGAGEHGLSSRLVASLALSHACADARVAPEEDGALLEHAGTFIAELAESPPGPFIYRGAAIPAAASTFTGSSLHVWAPPHEALSVPHQKVVGAPPYVPPTASDRLEYVVDGNFGARSLGVGVLKATWDTGWNFPAEWGRTWSGFGKRFVAREVQVGISNSIEAGLGALWGEDPRYTRSHRQGIWPRTGHAAKLVFSAHRRDGRLAPAWARYTGTVGNNLIANSWLPPSAKTRGATTWRIGSAFLGRFGANLWYEFWPDVRSRFFGRASPAIGAR